jgi:hypothetical protein
VSYDLPVESITEEQLVDVERKAGGGLVYASDVRRVAASLRQAWAALETAKDLKRQQEEATALLLSALVHRAGGSVTLLASDLKVAGTFILVRERVGAGSGVRFRVTHKARG